MFEVRSFGSDERLLVVYVPPFLKHPLNLPLSGGKSRMRKDEPILVLVQFKTLKKHGKALLGSCVSVSDVG